MKYTLFSVFFVLFGAALAQDQVILDGPCPDRPGNMKDIGIF